MGTLLQVLRVVLRVLAVISCILQDCVRLSDCAIAVDGGWDCAIGIDLQILWALVFAGEVVHCLEFQSQYGRSRNLTLIRRLEACHAVPKTTYNGKKTELRIRTMVEVVLRADKIETCQYFSTVASARVEIYLKHLALICSVLCMSL